MAKLSREIFEKNRFYQERERERNLSPLNLGNECIYSHQHSYLQLVALLSG